MKWVLKLKDKLLERKALEKGEDAKENKFLGFLNGLKFQCSRFLKWLAKYSDIVARKQKEFKKAMSVKSEKNRLSIEEKFGIYLKHHYKMLGDLVKSYSKASNRAKDKIDKEPSKYADIEEVQKWKDDVKNLEEARNNIEATLLNMTNDKIGIDELDALEDGYRFAIDCIKKDSKLRSNFIKLNIILFIIFELFKLNMAIIILFVILLNFLFTILVYKVYIGIVREYVLKSSRAKILIQNQCIGAFNTVTSKQNEKNYIKMPKEDNYYDSFKTEDKGKTGDMNDYPVQQSKQEEVYNNPYADTWRMIFEEVFPKNVKDKFKVPEYKKFETTEVHVFNIPTLTVDTLISKSEEIENYIGMNIYKIYRKYGSVGRIGVEFEIVELPVLIPYSEVPQPKKKDEIILGKGIKDWVTWNLNVSPHAYVVCPTRGGKSNTMNFLICEVLKQGWMPYFVDFKIVEFKIYESKGYAVISEREDYAKFVDELYGELLYRLKVLAEKGFKNINSLNKKYPNTLKRIVVFFDEYADVNSFKDDFTVNINKKIGQLLAKSGAVGINLFFSTQRPDAKVFGEGAFRDNVTCRIIGLMNSESGEKMARGVDALSKEDKALINKIPKDDRKRGMFVVQGTGSIDENEIIRVPYMDDTEFSDMVLNEWEDNPYADYKLHYEENNEAEEYEEKPVSKVDIQKLEKFRGKYAKDNVEEIQEKYDTHSTDFDSTDFIDL